MNVVPVNLEAIDGNRGAQRIDQALAVDLLFTGTRGEIDGEGFGRDTALAVGRRDGFLRQDLETRDAGELDEVAPIACLGELGETPTQPTWNRRGIVSFSSSSG